jgi:two-component system, NarL family, sensor kinase
MIISAHSDCPPVQSSVAGINHPHRIALIDAKGKIVAVNEAWKAFARESGVSLKRVGPGANYLDVCRQVRGAAARKAVAGILDVLNGKASSFVMDYTCDGPAGRTRYRMAADAITHSTARVVIAHANVTDLQSKSIQDFARRLMRAQEDERRIISREIHDDVGNRLALVSLSLRKIMQRSSDIATANELDKVLESITDLSGILRNLSHGLDPAPLRHLGIRAALKSLLDGFQQTYGVHMDVVIPPEMPRLADEAELCIFRITQESLQNIVKHSGADKIKIVLAQTSRQTRLTVSDRGQGFLRSAVSRKGGLGLLSMEERALSIGGRLTVNSAPGKGTEVCLTIPTEKLASVIHR